MGEIKVAFDVWDLQALNVLLKLDPWGLPDRDLLLFESRSEKELKVLHGFCATDKQDIFWWRIVQIDTHFMTHNFKTQLCYWSLKISKVMCDNKN